MKKKKKNFIRWPVVAFFSFSLESRFFKRRIKKEVIISLRKMAYLSLCMWMKRISRPFCMKSWWLKAYYNSLMNSVFLCVCVWYSVIDKFLTWTVCKYITVFYLSEGLLSTWKPVTSSGTGSLCRCSSLLFLY